MTLWSDAPGAPVCSARVNEHKIRSGLAMYSIKILFSMLFHSLIAYPCAPVNLNSLGTSTV